MPLSPRSQQAILAAFGSIARGVPVTTGDTSFWRHFGLPPWRQRQLIINRAEALAAGSREAQQLGQTGQLSDLWQGTPYAACGGRCGPAETERATVRGRVWFQDSSGRWTMRTYDKQFSWDTDWSTIQRSIRSWRVAMGRKYGLSDAGGDVEDFMIY